jgi:uncharacterized coiled-coil protein SlyX
MADLEARITVLEKLASAGLRPLKVATWTTFVAADIAAGSAAFSVRMLVILPHYTFTKAELAQVDDLITRLAGQGRQLNELSNAVGEKSKTNESVSNRLGGFIEQLDSIAKQSKSQQALGSILVSQRPPVREDRRLRRMRNVESVRAESAVEVLDVEGVAAGGMRLFAWPTREVQYGCRVEGGWALSSRLDLRSAADRAEILPVLEGIAAGNDHGPFGGDRVGGLIGCSDVTELAAVFYDEIAAFVRGARTPRQRGATKRAK